MKDAYAEDLRDFIRNGKLDAYELTDDELARFLEVWRWACWRQRTRPTGPDADIMDATYDLQARMAQEYGVEVDYNTLLLLRQELEPLMYMRVLSEFGRALFYFLNPLNLLAFIRTRRRTRRYDHTDPSIDWLTRGKGYPRTAFERVREPAPDLLRRKYWRQVGAETFVPRRRPYPY